MEHYKAHQLQHPFQIIRKTSVADGAGGFTETEQTLPSPSTYHHAFIRPLRGGERLVNEGIESNAEVLFVTWADIEIRQTDVLLYAGSRYNVSSLKPPGISRFREVEATSGGVT